MDKKHHVIILGAGSSGLSLAWRLASNGVKVDVLESHSQVGGLAGTVREGDYYLDYGPHSFFSEDNAILRTVLDLFDNTLTPQPRTVKFLYKGKYLDYPLTATSVLLQMGLISGLRAGFSFLKSKFAFGKSGGVNTEEETVEEWAKANFGNYLYESFFKPYTEQFWKVPCHELSSRSIPSHTRMSFFKTLKMLVLSKLSEKNLSQVEREKLPTYYPERGFGEITERVADAVRKAGGRIHLESPAIEIDTNSDNGVTVYFEDRGERRKIHGSYLVSTIPLHLFVKMMRPEPSAEVLESTNNMDYRSLVALGIITERQNILDCGYIYLLDRPYNRISEMNKFGEDTSPEGENILCLEICCLRGSADWHAPAEELLEKCLPSLESEGLFRRADVKQLMLVKAPYAYPIYRKDFKRHLQRLLGEVQSRDQLATLGRTGEFIYMDSGKCMRRAFDFGDRLLSKLGITPNPQPGALEHP